MKSGSMSGDVRQSVRERQYTTLKVISFQMKTSHLIVCILCFSLSYVSCGALPEDALAKLQAATKSAGKPQPARYPSPSVSVIARERLIGRKDTLPNGLRMLSALHGNLDRYLFKPNSIAKDWESSSTAMLGSILKPELMPEEDALLRRSFKDVPVRAMPEVSPMGSLDEPVDFVRIEGRKGTTDIQLDAVWRWVGITVCDSAVKAPATPPKEADVRRLLSTYFILPPKPFEKQIPEDKLHIEMLRNDKGVVSGFFYLFGNPAEDQNGQYLKSLSSHQFGWLPKGRWLFITDGRFIHIATGAWNKNGSEAMGEFAERQNLW